MGFLHLLVALLAANVALADDDCQCVNPDQQFDVNNMMLFFQQPTKGGIVNGVTCTMNCTFTGTLDTDNTNYSMQIGVLSNNNLGDGMLVYQGFNATNNVINSNTPTGNLPSYSYDKTITIEFTESYSNKGEFMIVIYKVGVPRPAPPVIITTTAAPPTSPYDRKFTNNPLLVANDIMLVFDASSNDLEKYKTFARAIIKELNINPQPMDNTQPEDCGAGSRLNVVELSNWESFNVLLIPCWRITLEQADGNIGTMIQMGSGRYRMDPLANYLNCFDAVPPPTSDSTSTDSTSCANRGKIVILFTSTSPLEFDYMNPGNSDLQVGFLDKGAHQILVHYGMNSTDKKYYEKYDTSNHNNRWNVFELTGGDKDVENFFNNYLVDSKEPMTCQLESTNNNVDIAIGKKDKPISVDLPPYYNAVGTTDGTTDGQWDTPRHYCNFQQTTIRLLQDKSLDKSVKIPMCVKVFYDLETGKDFVSIFSGDPLQPALQEEVVRLTGRDVSGTLFELPDALGSIVFSSDEKNVYDGFHAEIYPRDPANGCSV